MKNVLLLMLFASTVMAQTAVWNKKFPKAMTSSSIMLMQVVDVDAVIGDGYVASATKNGVITSDSTLYAWDFLTGTTEFSHKLPILSAANQSSTTKTQYVYLMKNLYSSKGEWSILRWYYDAQNVIKVEIFSNDKIAFSTSFTTNPTFYKFGASLYMYGVSASDSSHILYKLRSDLLISINSRSKGSIAKLFSFSQKDNGVRVTMHDNKSCSFTWKIMNIRGQELASGSSESTGNEISADIVINLAKANYLIQANSGDVAQTAKIAIAQ